MKKRTKVIISSLIALSTIIVAIPVVNATVFSYKRSTGTYSAYYDYSVEQKSYTTQYDWARSKWSGISSKVSINKTTEPSTATDMYFVGENPVAHFYGQTAFYTKNGSPADPNVKNWDYSVVFVYHNNMVADGMNNDTNKKSITTHEVGHSLGLAHTNVANSTLRSQSVMTSGSDPFVNFNVTSPSDYDKGELKYKWGN
ncbi:matrixin family metalloprotease [Paenibacillus solani]|uniref:matrixin family metalloprotease n=1 Tax=Paenibacillus solani TaxID=1705565 RepID=UPI0006C8C441|nr:matrixin family metalloprotease [Paenibacillus solani]